MNKINYQRVLDKLIECIEAEGNTPSLLLHSCCAPCSSYVLEYLSNHFSITVLYYNPNIFPIEEYEYRIEEQKRLIDLLPAKHKISFIRTDYEPERFYNAIKGYEDIPEGGERCFKCYELRLREAAEYAHRGDFDYFTTTLSISPLKNAQKLNEIGLRLEEEYGVKYLCSDFKKKNGYKRSVELSAEYNLYRQNYCGCVFSKKESENFMNTSIK
ncbi:MAG: epoxyqueuosine reductase QueH [Lachnospiraceae bacterium]|nr:epoxyqueuosine reductase QueH [Lachnospiraceae bacterium]MDE6253880.1 epoxyqueuosine reductase QueH [Lachnospiraceae bacterium]